MNNKINHVSSNFASVCLIICKPCTNQLTIAASISLFISLISNQIDSSKKEQTLMQVFDFPMNKKNHLKPFTLTAHSESFVKCMKHWHDIYCSDNISHSQHLAGQYDWLFFSIQNIGRYEYATAGRNGRRWTPNETCRLYRGEWRGCYYNC